MKNRRCTLVWLVSCLQRSTLMVLLWARFRRKTRQFSCDVSVRFGSQCRREMKSVLLAAEMRPSERATIPQQCLASGRVVETLTPISMGWSTLAHLLGLVSERRVWLSKVLAFAFQLSCSNSVLYLLHVSSQGSSQGCGGGEGVRGSPTRVESLGFLDGEQTSRRSFFWVVGSISSAAVFFLCFRSSWLISDFDPLQCAARKLCVLLRSCHSHVVRWQPHYVRSKYTRLAHQRFFCPRISTTMRWETNLFRLVAAGRFEVRKCFAPRL